MNILIIGLGSIATKHVLSLNNNNNSNTIYALRHSKKTNEVNGVKNIFSFSEVDKQLDFIIISNPTSEHFSTIEKCLKLKIPLFIEKPLFHSLENGQELVNRVLASNIKTYIACVLRFHPVIKFLKEYLSSQIEMINEINVYYGSYLPHWRPNSDFRTQYSANKELGGGVHLDLIHEVDYIYHVLGVPNKVTKRFTSKSSLKINSIDYANYCLEYSNLNVNIVLNYYRVDAKRTVEILFRDKTLFADLLKGTIKDHKGNELFSATIDFQSIYDEQLEYFCKTKHPMNDIQEAWEVLKIILGEDPER